MDKLLREHDFNQGDIEAFHQRALSQELAHINNSFAHVQKYTQSAYYTAGRANESQIKQKIYDLQQQLKSINQLLSGTEIQELAASVDIFDAPF